MLKKLLETTLVTRAVPAYPGRAYSRVCPPPAPPPPKYVLIGYYLVNSSVRTSPNAAYNPQTATDTTVIEYFIATYVVTIFDTNMVIQGTKNFMAVLGWTTSIGLVSSNAAVLGAIGAYGTLSGITGFTAPPLVVVGIDSHNNLIFKLAA